MNKKGNLLKIFLLVLAVAICAAAIIYLFPVFKNLATPEGQAEFKNKIDSLGFLGILALFGLQLAQIFLVVIPGEPIEILAGACYGGFGGFLFIIISVAITSTMIFFLVRKLGKNFVYNFYKKEKIEKLENNTILENTQNIELIMLILFLIPGTPKDLLVYIAGLLPINATRFIIISTLARIPSILSSTLVGAHLLAGNWGISILIYIITFVFIGIIILVANKIDKNKITKNVINSLKSN